LPRNVSHRISDCGLHVANMSREVADNFWKCVEMPGNKREQTATCRDTKSATGEAAES